MISVHFNNDCKNITIEYTFLFGDLQYFFSNICCRNNRTPLNIYLSPPNPTMQLHVQKVKSYKSWKYKNLKVGASGHNLVELPKRKSKLQNSVIIRKTFTHACTNTAPQYWIAMSAKVWKPWKAIPHTQSNFCLPIMIGADRSIVLALSKSPTNETSKFGSEIHVNKIMTLNLKISCNSWKKNAHIQQKLFVFVLNKRV